MKAFAPNGSQIIGSSEYVFARAEIQPDSFTMNEDGSIDFEWAGESKVFWDTQENVKSIPEYKLTPSGESPVGKFVYLDEEGNEWRSDQIVLKNDEEEKAHSGPGEAK